MNRRRFLVAVGSVVALSGCTSSSDSEADGEDQQPKTASSTDPESVTKNGLRFNNDVNADETEYGNMVVTGTAENVSGHDLDYAQLEVGFYDDTGARIETGLDNVSNLGAGSTWRYEVMYPGTNPDSVADIEFLDITTY